MRSLRHDGVPLDTEVICEMARDVVAEKRGIELDEVAMMSRSWVSMFRSRHRFCKMRQSSTDRPNSTVEDVKSDNLWRQELLDVCCHPADYGIDGCDEIPKDLLLGMDETPLHYGFRLKTYDTQHPRSVLILGSKEKRQVTGTPRVFFFPRVSA